MKEVGELDQLSKINTLRNSFTGFTQALSGFHGGNWIFELNEIRGELKFFKIKGEEKEGGKGNF